MSLFSGCCSPPEGYWTSTKFREYIQNNMPVETAQMYEESTDRKFLLTATDSNQRTPLHIVTFFNLYPLKNQLSHRLQSLGIMKWSNF